MWKMFSYEIQGRSHIKSDIPCQDKTFVAEINGIKMIALADGAGSAKLSHFGAETVTENICSYIGKNFDTVFEMENAENAKTIIIFNLLSKLKKRSADLSCRLEELASTLLFAAVKDNSFLIVHIGDGVIGYVKNGELKTASKPENGEFTNVTYFVTSQNAVSKMKIFKGKIKDIEGFVLMSDGTADSFYSRKESFIAPAVLKLLHINTILNRAVMHKIISESFKGIIRLKTQDDCSIAMISRFGKTLKSYTDMEKNEKIKLLGINEFNKHRIKQMNNILSFLKKGKNITQISRYIHLKPKYTKKRLLYLEKIGLISREDNLYISKTVT